MSSVSPISRVPLPSNHTDYADLKRLEANLLAAVGGQVAFAKKLKGFFRSAIDEVIDTGRTGRFFLSDLEKTEKTYLGTKFEILLRDWLGVERGIKLDLQIEGEEVDVKTTTSEANSGGWMIPLEAFDELCILIHVRESSAVCNFGIARARQEYLRSSSNRDRKTGFTAAGRKNIWWMAKDFRYTPNFWSMISEIDRTQIMQAGGGTQKIAALFERCIGMGISRVQIEAVAGQDDFMKRVRRNSGARDILAPKGIAILYSENDGDLMDQLGIDYGTREFVSYMPKSENEAALLRNAGHID